jgi:hypothetical protein
MVDQQIKFGVKQTFGIFAPILGLKQNFPVILLEKTYTSDNDKTHIQYGEIHRSKLATDTLLNAGGTKVQTPDTFPILHYHRFVRKLDAKEYLLAFTKAHIYYWDETNKTFGTAIHTCASDCTEWHTCTFNDKVIATNNVDKVLVWYPGIAGGLFVPLGTASGINYGTEGSPEYLTKAKYVEAFENYLHLGYTYENGVSKPQGVRWSDLGDETDWNTGDAGGANIGSRDFITGLWNYKGFLIIFKEESIYQEWLTEASTDIFNNICLSPKTGCNASHSIVMDNDGELYFFASDNTFRHLLLGEISQPIDPTVRNVKSSLVNSIKSTFVDEYGEIWWAIPYGVSATANNKIVKFKKGIWNQEDTAINAFGKYIKESASLFLTDLGADVSGYTKKLHDSEAGSNASYFVLSTDLTDTKGLSYYKRLLDLDIYVRKETSGSLKFEIKRDNETTWQSVGTITLTGNEDILIKHLAPDFRAKTFLIKVSSNDHYRFLGLLCKSTIVGER